MNGYPKLFLPLLLSLITLLFVSGLLLLPAFAVYRLDQQTEWLMDLSLSSGGLRHGFTAMHAVAGWLLVGFIGALWSIHMRSHWRKNENRQSGMFFIGFWGVLIATAFGIYYFGDPEWSKTTSLIHVGLGLSLPFVLIAHRKDGKNSLKNA